MDDNPMSSQTRLRDRLPFTPNREAQFRWRGNEISRVEGFTDAVFAFAVTLLVVALEVPHTFEGLLDVVRGFPAFVICFTILMLFWNAHYTYHRRYGLDDAFSRVMTMCILVLVLFFVYPLKFLFTMLTVSMFGLDMAESPHLDGVHQVRHLYVIYGLGFAGVWGLYATLYGHAWRRRTEIGLDAAELIYTRSSLIGMSIYVGVCLLSVVLALATHSTWLPGFTYFLLGPLQTLNGVWFGRRLRALEQRAAAAS
jgi:uncharacterized membrane protein